MEPAVESVPSDSVSVFLKRHAIGAFLALVALIAMAWPVLTGLVQDWIDDPDFSHGFLIPLISAWIIYRNRKEILALPARRSSYGLIFLIGSLLVFFVGGLGILESPQRFGLLGVVLGAVWFLLGGSFIRRNAFPLLFLVFCIPPPDQVFSPLRLALKEFATRISADTLSVMGVPVVANVSVLILGDRSLEVADACSGIRSLMAIITSAVLFAYMFRTGLAAGILLTLTAIPVTIANNVLRIVLVGLSVHSHSSLDLTQGLPHEALGLAVFIVSLAFLFIARVFYGWLFRWQPKDQQAQQA